MELSIVIEQVTREVIRYMDQIEQKAEIILLTQDQGIRSQKLLEKYTKLGVNCGLITQKKDELDTVKTIILFDITNDILYKLANGCSETPYLKLASDAILQGKQVVLVKEEVEIFKYEKSAPTRYFNKVLEHLEFLKKCGVEIAYEKDIPLYIEAQKLKEQIEEEGQEQELRLDPKQKEKAERSCAEHTILKLNKKLITEREVQEAVRKGAKVIEVMPRAIITQLAKDAIQVYNLLILEDNR